MSEYEKAEYEYKCDICTNPFDLRDGGYLGPQSKEDEACHPFVAFEAVCPKCDSAPDREKK